MGKKISHYVGLAGREELWLQLDLDQNDNIVSAKLRAIGGLQFLKFVDEWRGKLKGSLFAIEIPQGERPGQIMMREIILRSQEKWNPPYIIEQICHCRSIKTSIVDQAIVSGAHTPGKVSRQTSASTACGTCQPDVEALINYRLGQIDIAQKKVV